MSLLLLEESAVLRARVAMPREGAWVADVEVERTALLAGPVTLRTFDDRLRLVGTIVRAGVERDTLHAHIVGGGGGLDIVVAPQAYRFVPARTIFRDLLAAAGEQLSTAADDAVLATNVPYWTREAGPCSVGLTRLCTALDVSWRVLADGSVWVGRDTWPEIAPFAFDLLEDAPSEGRQILGVEAPSLLPGSSLSGRHVALVMHSVGDGAARTEVWFEREGKESGRLFDGLRRWLRKATARMDTLALYPARVVSQNADGTLEVKPDSDRLPGLSRVRIKAGLPGVLVRVASGARVVIAFEEGDPRLPVATLWEDAKLTDLRIGGERGVARVADSVVVPIPQGYEFKATIQLGVPAAIGLALYPASTITILPTAPKALTGTIVTGSSKLKA
jgi:hypothetical protein